MNCGNLHIRTPLTDASLSPNSITQLIVATGLRIGVIPESTVSSPYYNIIIKNNINQIIYLSECIPYVGVNNYIHVVIPFDFIPKVGETISIQIISKDDCKFLTNYVVLAYILPNFNIDSTEIQVNNKLEKYIKIKPTITTGGFESTKTYYYNCSLSTMTDEDCFIEFNKNKNLSKILDKLPKTDTITCPPALQWNFSDIICISPKHVTTPPPCRIVSDSILFKSGSIYRVTYSFENVIEFTWRLYNSTNTELLSNTVVTNYSLNYFDADFGNLNGGTYKLVLAPNFCTSTITLDTKYFTGVDANTTASPITNEVPDMILVSETYWNHFNPDKIPDIIIPNRLDSITNKYVPNKWLIFNSFQGLSKFGATSVEQITQLFKKGFTHISNDALPIYETNLENYVNGDKIVGISKTNVDDTLINFKNFIKNSFNFSDTYKITKTGDKFNLFANFLQYQGRLNSADSQEATNFLVTGHYSALENTNGRFGYSTLSYDNSGGYITSDTYSRGNLPSFIGYSDNTVETPYKNKSLKESTQLILGTIQTYYYETLLPQNYQVKDHTNNDWFTINHFGGEATNTVGVGNTPNSEHWASQIAGNAQNLYNRAKVFGQDVVITIKPTCDRGDTYLHSKSLSIYLNGKYIKEYGQYKNLLYNISNGEPYESNYETEVVSNFVAEGQVILAYFAGARGINFNSNYLTTILTPREKISNVKKGTRYDNVTVGNQDYDAYNYTMKAMWRLSKKITIASNITYSFFDICDGNEIYLNSETEISYNGGTTFIKQRALDWQINQTSPILCVVNLEKNVIAICALQAYAVEQNSAIIRYNKNGRTFQQSVLIPTDKISIYLFDLGQIT